MTTIQMNRKFHSVINNHSKVYKHQKKILLQDYIFSHFISALFSLYLTESPQCHGQKTPSHQKVHSKLNPALTNSIIMNKPFLRG
jgi:hypothetical protein